MKRLLAPAGLLILLAGAPVPAIAASAAPPPVPVPAHACPYAVGRVWTNPV